ncbi:hypothetical protein CEE55_01615 [Stenotrophomonas pavanii]|uniref:Uncharacterized protein n=1 Tax=Stenotrophomonas pavanii TaxID=487698 RepID=A0A246L3D5_9GAMM|nr:hypothetical protein [Stenotrophomonas pavanii]OWR35521.1 hypothetical protein CEE55_01615 [Stenotrophomonas pavanii]
MTTDKKTLADAKPGGRVRLGDQRSDLVPGIVRCAKCSFQLHRTNLYLQSGTVGAGDSKTEPCPNGCGPLWPVTWETWAREGWAEAERLHLENAALAARQPVASNQVVEDIEQLPFDTSAQPSANYGALAVDGARQPVGEPITVEAVATVRRNGDGDRYIDWLTEGGIADLEVGDVLIVSDRGITDEDGSGEVYAAPPGGTE